MLTLLSVLPFRAWGFNPMIQIISTEFTDHCQWIAVQLNLIHNFYPKTYSL
jgi:hypothetical protein